MIRSNSFFIPSTTPKPSEYARASSSFWVSSTAVSTMDCKTFFCSVASKTSFGFVALRSSSAALALIRSRMSAYWSASTAGASSTVSVAVSKISTAAASSSGCSSPGRSSLSRVRPGMLASGSGFDDEYSICLARGAAAARPRREGRGALREQGEQEAGSWPSSSRRWSHLCGCGGVGAA